MKTIITKTYDIIPINDNEYKVVKYSNNFPEQEYTVQRKRSAWSCNCISGHIRGTCKHKDWISAIRSHKALPDNIKLIKQIDGEVLRKNILKSLAQLKESKNVKAKRQKKVEKSEKNTCC